MSSFTESFTATETTHTNLGVGVRLVNMGNTQKTAIALMTLGMVFALIGVVAAPAWQLLGLIFGIVGGTAFGVSKAKQHVDEGRYA